jgi:hypothetical protein
MSTAVSLEFTKIIVGRPLFDFFFRVSNSNSVESGINRLNV